MKAIILISSIFYILGLKVSHTFEFVKKSNPVDKVISVRPGISSEQSKSITLKESIDMIIRKDSLQKEGVVTDLQPKTE